MVQELSISEARRKLPSLLKAIQKDPSLHFRIRVRQETVATISSARKGVRQGRAVSALMRLMKQQEGRGAKGDAKIHSGRFKDYLYGKSRS